MGPIQRVKEEDQAFLDKEDWFVEGSALSDLELQQLFLELQSGARPFDFYAVFTEPFWTIYFFGNRVLFMTSEWDVPELVPLEYPFNPDTQEVQKLRFFLFDDLWEMKVTKGKGSDGMSEISYPYMVEYGELRGAGATKRMHE